MRTALVILVFAMAGCSKHDDCQRFVDKSKSLLEGMAKGAGKELKSSDMDQLVEQCRKQHGKPGNKDDAMMKCVLDAKDDAAVAECWGAAFGDYKTKTKMIEAKLQLNKLGKTLKTAFVTNAEFPKGKTGPTPAEDCCKGQGGTCAVTDAWTKDPVWQALDFQIDEPARFRYTYESDGKTATATAIGDLDCDGTAITYTLSATAPDGNPTVQLGEPPPDAD